MTSPIGKCFILLTFKILSQCKIPSPALDFVEVKYGWASASLAVILRSGSYKSNLLIKCHPSLHNTLVAYKNIIIGTIICI